MFLKSCHIYSLLIFLTMFDGRTSVKAQIAASKPVAKYISESVYVTTRMTPNKKGFILGKEMPKSKGKYLFSFYSNHILIKTNKSLDFAIEKTDNRFYPRSLAYFVKSSTGERRLIVLSVNEIDGVESWYINMYEDYRKETYNSFTMIKCMRVR